MDVGAQLGEARRRRGITLEDIASSTKISRGVLEQIERSRFTRLPGGIFMKGHLRANATAVGLDPEQVVQDFLASCEAALPAAKPPPQPIEPQSGMRALLDALTRVMAESHRGRSQ